MSFSQPTLADFRIAFPEFSEVPDETVQYYLDLASELVCESLWSSELKYQRAVMLVAAHMLYLSLQRESGAGGGIQPGQLIASESVGDVSVSMDNSLLAINAKYDPITHAYNQTAYGREYLMLLRTVGFLATTTALI